MVARFAEKKVAKKRTSTWPMLKSPPRGGGSRAVAGREVEEASGEQEEKDEKGRETEPVEQGACLALLGGKGRDTVGIHQHGEQALILVVQPTGTITGEDGLLHVLQSGKPPQNKIGAIIVEAIDELFAEADALLGPPELLQAEGRGIHDVFLPGEFDVEALKEVERRVKLALIKQGVRFQKYSLGFRFIHASGDVPIAPVPPYSIADKRGDAMRGRARPGTQGLGVFALFSL